MSDHPSIDEKNESSINSTPLSSYANDAIDHPSSSSSSSSSLISPAALIDAVDNGSVHLSFVPSNSNLLTKEEKNDDKNKESSTIFGCSHYRKNCLIRSVCCSNFYACRFDHDEAESHEIDRFKINDMICLYCYRSTGKALIQAVNQYCVLCKKSMANYYCSICHLFDDIIDPEREIFHCSQCGICRRGKQSNYFHCNKCCCCYPLTNQSHKCIEKILHSNCPICLSDLFSSTSPVQFLSCSHAIHEACLKMHRKNNTHSIIYGCPTCRKSYLRSTEYEESIGLQMENELKHMPDEYKKVLSIVLCNDCEKLSQSPYHFLYHRCNHCGSWNTHLKEKKSLSSLQEVIETVNKQKKRIRNKFCSSFINE